jgi:hypothetical protein
MNVLRFKLMVAATAALALCGCGDTGEIVEEGDDGDSKVQVCGYKESHGVFVGQETREAIRLQVADVTVQTTAPVVPESSVLSTATGDFVFTVNGAHFRRTEIKLGGRDNGWVVVADGLLEGDQVVTNGVRELWRIELQATKGGYACCAVEKKE